MQYDPIKRSLGKVFNYGLWTRKLLYRLLDLILLRSWYISREIKKWLVSTKDKDKIYILDAGSGFGQYTYFLQSVNKRALITGIDVKQEQIDDCNNFFSRCGIKNVKFELGDLTTYAPQNNFDFILCVDVMEHIEDDISVFNNFGKMMNKGGLLLISTPSDLGGSDVHHEDDESFIDEHVREGYNKDDITQKLMNAGFSKVNTMYSYGKYGKMAWKLSMKIPITCLNMSKIFFLFLPFYYVFVFPVAYILNSLDVRQHNITGTGLIVKAVK